MKSTPAKTLLTAIKRIKIMIKTILGAAIVVATLSTGAQAANMGHKMMMDKNSHMMMMHKNPHMIKMQCEGFKHRAHGKCESTMNKHK